MTVSSNFPSAGHIAWSGMHIQYMGVSHAIEDGSTNKMYAYWTPSIPGSLQTSDLFPNLEFGDCLVLLNRGGTATIVPTATVLPGDLIVPGTVKADKIDVNSLFANAAFLQKLQVGAAYAGATSPDGPAVGQLWRNTGVTPNELLAWTGKGTGNARRYAAARSGASVMVEDLSDSDGRALNVTVKTVATQAGSGTSSPANIRAIGGKGTVTAIVNGTSQILAPASTLYGFAGAEDERGSDGHETHRTSLYLFTGSEAAAPLDANSTATHVQFNITPGSGWKNSAAILGAQLCSHFPIDVRAAYAGVSAECLWIYNATMVVIRIAKSRLTGWSDSWTSVQKRDALQAWFLAQASSGAPVQLLHQIASPVTTSGAAAPIFGADGANTITSDGASVTVSYTGSGWASVGNVQRLGVEAVTITPEEGLRVDTVLSSPDGAHLVPTFFNARGSKYGLFRASDGVMMLGGMVLPSGQPAGVAGALVEPGSSGDSRIQIETSSEGTGEARTDTAALHLVQPSFAGATGSNPSPTGEKTPFRVESIRNTVRNGQDYADNFSASVKALGALRLAAVGENGGDLAWLQLQETGGHGLVYTGGAFGAADADRTLSNFAPRICLSMPTGESIAYNTTARRYMLDWKTVEDSYGKFATFKGGSASAREVGIVIPSAGCYRFVFHADFEQASSSSGAVLHINRMPSDWAPPTARDYCTDADLTPSSGPTRLGYRRAASAPLNASITTCELVADMWCSGGEKILPVAAMAAASKTLVSAGTFFSAQKIG